MNENGGREFNRSAGEPECPLDWPSRMGLGAEMAAEVRTEVRRRKRARRNVVMGVTALALLCVAVWRWSLPGTLPTNASAAAVVVSGPTRDLLPDGSVIEKRGDAVVRVHYTPGQRTVELLAGEAHFTVAKNAARPFVVLAGGVQVRAVGTAFAVDRQSESVDVLVTEGRVAVAESGAPATGAAAADTPVATLNAGSAVSINWRATDGAIMRHDLPGTAVTTRLTWRIPRFELSGAKLSDVVELYNRHGYVWLALGDEELGAVRVSGLLRADNADVLLELLQADHGIRAEKLDGKYVLKRGS